MKAFAMSASVLALVSATPVLADAVPDDLLGHWAIDARCDDPARSIHVDAATLAFGADEGEPITYYPEDSPTGNGAIHWSEEGVVDNFEFDPATDTLLHNTEGYGMGTPPDVFKRCKG